ncbi:MAG TPA: tetratricopeptide repeat protein [Terriglobales bacterium]|jgi:tetratricopeptide (TPR) repeat protein|nr:tetratricopeptide repeat protein [Terriglobales bacterium]
MADATPSIGRVLGHYRIVEKIGAGGMGVVFRARDERLDRDVALKILPKQVLLTEAARRQFRREALSLARITDSHVAMAFDFGQDNGITYLVTEYVPGLTLDAKLAGRPLPEGEVLQLGKQLAAGLEAAHKEGVIHRDLKPGNLKITPDGRLKILDFGLAYILRTETEVSETAPLAETYSDAGTLPYMGPEQVKGQTPDERADLWSAGIVLYEMSTGKTPFGNSTGAHLIAAILEQAPVLPRVANSKISEGLERVILRALQKDPKERYQSAGDLRIDLANLATGTAPIYPKQASSPNSWLWPAIAILTLVVIGLGALWLRHRSEVQVLDARMMAVLPFESVAGDAPTNALGRGLTETVTARLVQAADGGKLQLVSTRDLVEHGVKTSEQAQREFGTDLVLEGSLQQDGARIRINWSLVNPRTHTQIAANTITGDTNNIFGLQDTIFDDVLAKLPPAARPRPQEELEERPDTKPVAYDFYLRGRGYLEDYKSQDNIDNAIADFQSAIAADQNYAPAYAAMGLAYNTGFVWKNRDKDWVDKAKTDCNRALALMPQLAEGHTCLGNVFLSTGRYEDAVRELEHSLDLDHNSDETLSSLAAAYQKLGKASAAEDAYRKAVSLRPNYWRVYNTFGAFYLDQARYSDAAEMFKKTIQLAPLNYRGYSNLGATDLMVGQYQEAVDAFNRSIALRPTGQVYGNLGAAYFYMRRYQDSAENLQQALKIDPKDWLNWGNLGDTLFQISERRAEAKSAYQKAIELAKLRLEVNPQDATILAFIADYYAMLDQERESREQMARALQTAPEDADVLFRGAILCNHFGDSRKTLDFLTKSVAAGYSRTLIRDTPDFDHLKDDQRFRALLIN